MRCIRSTRASSTPILPPIETRWQSAEAASHYDRQRFSTLAGRLFNHLSLSALRRALRAVPGGPGRTLDIPCGTGRATAIVCKAAREVVGADISLAMLTEARRRLGHIPQVNFVEADIMRQPFPDGSFDCLTSIRLMMHLGARQRQAALREMARVARRYVIVEYGYISAWLRVRRAIKQAWRRLRGRPCTWVGAATWNQIAADVWAAGLKPVRRFRTAWGLSESVILLLGKVDTLP